MSKIVPQIVKGEISNQVPFILLGRMLERTEPMVNAIFCEMCASLRSKDIYRLWITTAVLEIVVEWTACFIQEVNVAELFPFMSNMQPPDLRTNMRMFPQLLTPT